MRRTDPDAQKVGDSSDQHAAPVVEFMRQSEGQAWRRWLALASLVAIIGAVALGAALVEFTSKSLSPASGTTGPLFVTAKPGAPLPKGVEVTDFAPVGPDVYWATGEVVTNTVSDWPDASVILRFSGGRWTQVGGGLPSVRFTGIQMVSSGEGWAWGQDGSGAGVLVNITGGRWKRVSAPAADPNGSPQLLRMGAAGDAWLVMRNGKNASGDIGPSSLLHEVGGVWRLVRTPLAVFLDVAPANPNEAWLLGSDGHKAMIVHLVDGRSTVSLQIPPSTRLSSLRALTPNDIWAMGARMPAEPTPPAQPASPDSFRPALYHYDGSSWQPVSAQAPAGVEEIQVISADDMWAMRHATTPVFLGQQPGPDEWRLQALYHLSAGQWRQIALPYRDLMRLVILPSPPTASGDVWALGYYTLYTVETSSPGSGGGSGSSGADHTALLHYLNGAWVEYGR